MTQVLQKWTVCGVLVPQNQTIAILLVAQGTYQLAQSTHDFSNWLMKETHFSFLILFLDELTKH